MTAAAATRVATPSQTRIVGSVPPVPGVILGHHPEQLVRHRTKKHEC